MIRAVQINQDAFARNMTRWAFELITPSGERLIYGRPRRAAEALPHDFPVPGGWFRMEQIETRAFGVAYQDPDPDALAEMVIVDLPRDVAAALADAILTEATGTPAGDVRALRADLTHERDRRDLLEDKVVELLDRLTPVVVTQPS